MLLFKGPKTLSGKIAYSSGNFSVYLMQQMVATYIVFFYVDELGVRPGLISVAMVFHGIVNAAVHPLLGHLSDRTRSRWGRRIPYILFGSLPLAVVFTMIWIPPASEIARFWYFLGLVLLFDALFVMVSLNWTSLFPEMFQKLKDRSFVSSWRQMWGIIGMIVGVAVPPLLYVTIGWQAMGLLFGFLVLFFWIYSLYGSKQNDQSEVQGIPFLKAFRYTLVNKAFITFALGNFCLQLTFVLLQGAAPFFTKYVLHTPEVGTSMILGTIFIVAIPFVYIWGKLVNRWGPRTTIMAAILFLFLALVPFLFIQSFLGAMLTAIVVGMGIAGVLVLIDLLLSEVIDQDERKTGARREGMYFGINGFITRGCMAFQAGIMGVVLEMSGYVANAASQPAAAKLGIRMMISGIPMFVLLLALICFMVYPIRRSIRQTDNPSKDVTIGKN